jgi:hypothetical protein
MKIKKLYLTAKVYFFYKKQKIYVKKIKVEVENYSLRNKFKIFEFHKKETALVFSIKPRLSNDEKVFFIVEN